MNTKLSLTSSAGLMLVLTLSAQLHAFAQWTTAFNYQGQLRDGGINANGTYTMIFNLFDSASGGNQVGDAVTNSPTLVNGVFTVNLDFGSVFNGLPRWLDITISKGPDTEQLSPRVRVLASPYAQYATAAFMIDAAVGVTNGTGFVTQDAWHAGIDLSTSNGPSHDFVIDNNNVAQMLIHTNGRGVFFPSNVVSGGTFYGDGSGLTNLGNGNGLTIPHIQIFTNDGTFVVPSNVTRIMVEMWGGGGGGGAGASDPDTGWLYPGGGGGAGAYAWNVFNVTPGETNIVKCDSGAAPDHDGTASSFGPISSPLLSASGGSAGGAASLPYFGAGGPGGQTTSGGMLAYPGGSGANGFNGAKGGGVWRGGTGSGTGPGDGGGGGNGLSPGQKGSSGLIIVSY
jgi:hypothetical protein